MIKKLVPAVLMFSCSLSFATVIEKVIPPKGYILSVDLFQKKCPKIWSQQIPIFKQNNPKVKNPDIISIGKEILVQNCEEVEDFSEENAETMLVDSQPEKKVEKNKKEPFFVIGSVVGQLTSAKNGDSKKEGTGFKFEFGKYFQMNDQELKVSLGIINTKSRYNYLGINSLKMEKALILIDTSYLYDLANRLKVGPSFGVMYSPTGAAYNNPERSERDLAIFAGGNVEYSLTKNVSVDFKLNNQIENRVNLMSSLGLEYKF